MPTTTVTANLQGKSLVGHYGDNSLTWLDLLDETSGLTPNSTTYQTSTKQIGVEFANNDFGGTSITKSLGRAFFFFDNLDTLIGSGNIITSATLRIPSGIIASDPNLDTILVSGSAWGGDGSNNTLSSDDFYNLDSSISYSSVLPSPWNDFNNSYNTFTLNSNAISDMNNNGYLNCVLINAQYDQAMSAPTVNSTNPPPTATITYKNSILPIELVLTYTTPPPQVSTTQSIEISSNNLTAGEPIIYNINNPLNYSSYFTLETTRNADGFYDTTSPQNISGSFSLGNGIIDMVNDNYKAGIIIAPGGGELTFTPANNVVSSSLLLRGTGWSGVEYQSCSPSNGIGVYVNFADENTGEPTTSLFLVRLDHIGGNEIAYEYDILDPIIVQDLYWDSSIDKWRFAFSGPGGLVSWTSNSLISSNWEAQQPAIDSGLIVESTTCGYPELDRWCVTLTGDFGSGVQTFNVNAPPVWSEIEVTEEPNGWYFYIGFYIWIEESNQWAISTFGETFLVGGTRNILPSATVETVAVGEITFSPSLGVCS